MLQRTEHFGYHLLCPCKSKFNINNGERHSQPVYLAMQQWLGKALKQKTYPNKTKKGIVLSFRNTDKIVMA